MSNRLLAHDAARLHECITTIRHVFGTIVVGQTNMIDHLVAAFLADGHVLLEGMPGVAKTLSARLMAKLVDATFSRIQCTPDLMPADIVGTSVFDQRSLSFEFRPGPVFANMVLVDEINRAPAKTQSALFEVMEERQITVDGVTHVLAPPFMVLATQNPVEQEGTYRLPEAQLDRFLVKIVIPFPTLEEEERIVARVHSLGSLQSLPNVAPVMNANDVISYRSMIQTVAVEPSLFGYIAAIVHATRNNPSVDLGASPRASLAILALARAFAVLDGRDFVTPDDIQKSATPVLRHRIQLFPERELEGLTEDRVIAEILAAIDVPR
ncbi:MAG: MoxR family ATPase [Candidatus Kapabacteria bacterium]|jgi:MoxR-like ATPase|nr:MoxR family ATPase [Candidatus Kapabacteria bacterium]